jgi:HSP20 family protein
MTMLMEPLAPWLRDVNRFITDERVPAAFIPPADVIVTDEGVSVFMDVPGLNRDNLEVDLQNDTLTIRGERPFPYEAEAGQRVWRHVERRFGRFERTLRVPGGMDPNAIEASLSHGVLSLRIPKPESLKPHRVEIRSEEGGRPESIEGTASGSRQGAPSGGASSGGPGGL